MKRTVIVSVVAGALGILTPAGTSLAYASWKVMGSTLTMAATTSTMPTPGVPNFHAHGNTVKVTWQPEFIEPDVKVQRYVVTRHGGGAELTTVCGGMVRSTNCTDSDVPPGTWTYSVRAVYYRWTSQDSRHSEAVTVGPKGSTKDEKAMVEHTTDVPEPTGSSPTAAPTPDISPQRSAPTESPSEPSVGDSTPTATAPASSSSSALPTEAEGATEDSPAG